MADIYQEAADAIINSDRAAAEDVATRAIASGIAPGDIMPMASSRVSRRSASSSRAARSSSPSS